MNFEFLSTFQLTTFVLGIVFSILTIAVVFYTLRHPDRYRSLFVKILFTIIVPFVMFMMWFACVFAAYEILDSNELYIMLISIACGAAVMGLVVGVAYLIERIVKNKEQANEEQEEIEEVEDATEATELANEETEAPVEAAEPEQEVEENKEAPIETTAANEVETEQVVENEAGETVQQTQTEEKDQTEE